MTWFDTGGNDPPFLGKRADSASNGTRQIPETDVFGRYDITLVVSLIAYGKADASHLAAMLREELVAGVTGADGQTIVRVAGVEGPKP